MQCLDTYLIRQLRNKNYALLEKCLQVTGRLYERGNPLVRNAVTRIIVPDLSRERPVAAIVSKILQGKQ
ncbi:hypothetical protein ACFOTA_22270 [Chitinophaga sp. GCM10012297]|uniref:DUF7674 domain-containing protein n=1 Tax=Chitinophaga chungangae TaxID=2821488 RepID=A0ABS3YL30_9BACT|nr:hypothetical protein [Chitinophaga chungangae]MBO9154958.1 hypothetical protein [Chitinophaga chungangae]